MQKSINYWGDLLSMKIYEQKDKSILLGYDDSQAKLELKDIGKLNSIIKNISFKYVFNITLSN